MYTQQYVFVIQVMLSASEIRFTVHHQESSNVYTAISICHTGYVDCLLARSGLLSITRSLVMYTQQYVFVTQVMLSASEIRFTVHHQGSSNVYAARGICHTGYVDCLLARSGLLSITRSLVMYTQQYVFVIQVMLSTSKIRFTVHHQESSNVHVAIGICHTGYAVC